MNNKLFIGSLPYAIDSEGLGQHFATAGEVLSAKVITDRESGRSKGFGFVEMSTDEAAQTAIDQFNGKDLMGRAISVAVARPQENRPRSGGSRDGGSRDGGGFRRGY
jgi:RNA recognition motif-containing protein